MTASGEGLYYINGGVLQSDHSLPEECNRICLYERSTLPSLGYVLQGNVRVSDTTHDFYATMVNLNNGNVVFVNRALEFSTLRELDEDYENDSPVLILVWQLTDLETGNYKMQPKAIDKTAVTSIEYFTPVDIEVLERVE